ncbi:hypothetical protein Tco_0720185 [Tanacetum coccineum]
MYYHDVSMHMTNVGEKSNRLKQGSKRKLGSLTMEAIEKHVRKATDEAAKSLGGIIAYWLDNVKGAQSVDIRPYRHPPTQKDAIEAIVKELLEAEIIKPIQQLNKKTIKDKFSIPFIEELIDELHGASVLSKLE